MNLGAIIGQAQLGDTELANIPADTTVVTPDRVLEPTRGDDNILHLTRG